jgi:hypothetical protein
VKEGDSTRDITSIFGNFDRSAKERFPLYRISGGAGFVWAASFDQKGRGTLRLVAVDISAFDYLQSRCQAERERAMGRNVELTSSGRKAKRRCHFYRDVPAALSWLARVFGFAKEMGHLTPNGMHAQRRQMDSASWKGGGNAGYLRLSR